MSDQVVPGMADAIERRRLVLGLGKGQLASKAGLSREGLSPILKGYRRSYNDASVIGVARALRWQVDWYDRLQHGDAPEEDTPGGADVETRLTLLEEAVAQIRQLLERGLDTSSDAPRADGGSR